MATLNKQMKGFKSFYKSRDGGRNVSSREPISMSSVDKTSIYKYNWLGRKSKKATEQHGGGGGGGGVGGIREEIMGGRKVVVEGRKSVSHVETNLGSVASFLQVKVLVSDMPEIMQIQAFRTARRSYDSLEKFSSKHMAYNIKKEFDKVYGPAWHCIVGSSFGSFVTHSTGCFLYFSMEKLYILLFRTKIQKAIE
uniref:Dynein light chain n=1 Tax=Cucumis sativus TaxID=3659 RepID=A0A0A0LKY0_CUCSA